MIWSFQTKAKLAKSCPLCGSKHIKTDKTAYLIDHGFKMYTIECETCGLTYTGKRNDDLAVAYREALKGWNRRVKA